MLGRAVSLDEVAAGEKVRIRTILFGVLRQECQGIGLTVGAHVCVRRRSGRDLHVELARGSPVALKRQWAPFIEVEPAGG